MSVESLIFEQSLSLEQDELSKLRHTLELLMKRIGVDSERTNQVITAVHEWLVNLIKHPKIKPTEVIIQVVRTQDGVYLCKIKDSASAFSNFERKLRAANISLDGQESGYGLFILREYFSYIAYSEKSEGKYSFNQLSFAISEDQPYQFNKPRIAVIDDDKIILAVIKKYLSDQYLVEVFETGEAFIAIEDKSKFSLILCDISLPGIDGFSIRSQMAVDKQTDMIPFVFLTARDDVKSIHIASSLGIDDYITKPFKKRDLCFVLNRILKRKESEKKVFFDVLDEKLTDILKPGINKKVKDYDCASWSESASSGGGDFLIHHQADGSEFIILGDVMGHGKSAKFYAHMYAGYVRSVIKTCLNQSNTDLCYFLSKLSDFIHDDCALDTVIVTLLCLQINSDGVIRICNAGHPLPLKVYHNEMHEVAVTGSLLGLCPDLRYETKEIHLRESEKLILFTDGLYEAGKDNQERDNNKNTLLQLIKNQSNNKVDVLAKCIHNEFDRLTQGQPDDDTTMLVIGINCKKHDLI